MVNLLRYHWLPSLYAKGVSSYFSSKVIDENSFYILYVLVFSFVFAFLMYCIFIFVFLIYCILFLIIVFLICLYVCYFFILL